MAREAWAAAAAYDAYVGRWSRPVSERFVDWLDVPEHRDWADVGCGTGALTATVLALAEPARIVAVDTSEPFLARARRRITDPRASFRLGDAQALPLADGSVDAAVSGLAINFVPDQQRAAAELARVTRPGGVAAAYVWDYAEGMAMMRLFWDAAASLDPAVADLNEDLRFPLCRPEPLRALWDGAGLEQATVRAIDVPTHFADFDDFWSPFLAGQGPAPAYAMSLPEADRDALRELLRARLPVEADGSIALSARAWAVRGRAQ